MEHVASGTLRLAFERSGAAGDPVVLIHGGWDDHHTWDAVVPGLAESLQVLGYDRRGHGESRGEPRARPVRDDARDLAVLLEATGDYPAHLVGHSYGGVVALYLAVERPELVRSVAVHEAPFLGLEAPKPPGRPSVAEEVRRLRGLARRDAASAAGEYLRLFGSAEEQWSSLGEGARQGLVAHASAWADEMADPDTLRPPFEDLAAVPVPVLVTTGGRSPAFARAIDERLAEGLPNATALRLSEGGHFVQRTDPGLLVGLLGSFLVERNVPST